MQFGTGQVIYSLLNISESGVFDSDDTFNSYIWIPDRAHFIVKALLFVTFHEFWAPATSAASGGGQTSGSATTPSGGGSTSGSGGSSTPTSSSQAAHQHRMFDGDFAAGSATNRLFVGKQGGGSDYGINLPVVSGSGDMFTHSADGAHDHTVTIPSHTHSTPNHTHPSHDHTVSAHTHDLTYGIFKEPMPASWSVIIGVYRRNSSGGWDLLESLSGLTDETEELDITELLREIDPPEGIYRLTFQSDAGQPNGGRVGVDVAGTVVVGIASS